MKLDKATVYVDDKLIGDVTNIQINFGDTVESAMKENVRKKNNLFVERFNILECASLSEDQVLMLDPHDFSAIQYINEPDWTHYFYKGKRVISFGPMSWSDVEQDENGNYVSEITQQYY